MLEAINELIQQNAAALWVLPAIFLLATFDALLPPVPSESVVITLAAFGAAHGSPHLLALGAAAAVGAFLGDNLTFAAARRSGLGRLRNSPRPRMRSAFRRAEDELDRRGGLAIIVARYIPVGRVAVNVTAGAGSFDRRRFVLLSAVAATMWAGWSVAIGALAGNWVEENPLLGAIAAIAVAATLGMLVDRVLSRAAARVRD
ncbi:DedA family protein [Knoellia subterranea]|uniref:DedA family protein n=1 Tax=Knoellia subterranea TaxID=184882 RepID=UPI00068D4DED|nr:VTT domain-containing protein [Knoellia subterranea]